MYAKKNSGKKVIATLLAVVLLIGCGIGGTLAWLMDTTGTVTNTFTVGNVDIDLKEHDLNADGTLNQDEEVTEEDTYKIIPGTSQPKDPFVRVEGGSEACWVFVKVEEVNNTAVDYLTYDIDVKNDNTGTWTPLGDDYPNIYYVDQAATTADVTLNILKGQKVSYSDGLTKADIDKLYNTDDDGNKTIKERSDLPQLKFTAYAIQKVKGNSGESFTATEAWTELNKAPTNP